MAEMTEAYDWRGRTMLDAHGEKIGKIDQVYLGHSSDQPEWALVDTGGFGSHATFVPVGSARPEGEDVRVQVDRDAVKAAPAVDVDVELSADDEAELLRHYGVGQQGQTPLAEPPPDSHGTR